MVDEAAGCGRLLLETERSVRIIDMPLKSLLLGLSFAVSASSGQSPWDQTTIFQQLAGPIDVRIKALHTISDSKGLLATRVQG